MDAVQTQQVRTLIRWLKDGPPGGGIPVEAGSRLAAVTWEDAGDRAAVERLAGWHGWSSAAARGWLAERVLPDPDRLLFWVEEGGDRVGHVGFVRPAEVTDVLCDGAAVRALCGWLAEVFGPTGRPRRAA